MLIISQLKNYFKINLEINLNGFIFVSTNQINNMKTLIITLAIVLTSVVTFGQTKVVKTFRCHDQYSNTNIAKRNTIDSLAKKGYVLIGFRVDNTVAKKGYNTQVLTFVKRTK